MKTLYCKHCRRVTEPADPGEAFPQCVHCGSRNLLRTSFDLRAATRARLAPERARVLFAQLREVVA